MFAPIVREVNEMRKTSAEREEYEVKTVGLSKRLYFHPGPSRCGNVTDGVSFELGREGSFVIPFRELRNMYIVAERIRHKGAYED